MDVFEVVVALLLGGAALAALARRLGAPYPALVALAGAALALLPGVPTLVLDPELALALFVAPVLVDAAFDASPRDLRANWRQVASLALGAVALTIGVVAVVVRLLVPDMPWAAASALIVYRLAVAATVTGFVSGWSVLPTLLVVTIGSIALVLVLARPTLAINARISDVPTAIVFQFCQTFAVWVLAERLHLSGIITMVVFAMAASRRAPEVVPARVRIPSWAVWGVAVFVLNVLAFILVGFQLRSIAARATGATGARYAVVAVTVCVAVILARIAWVTGAAALSRWRGRPRAGGTFGARDAVGLSAPAAAVVGWCGMRGTVTLAAALALPTGVGGAAAFPYRDLILVTAFGVVLGTLVVQGLAPRPLLLRLELHDDGAVEREVRRARVEALRAAVAATEECPRSDAAALVRQSYALQLRRAEEQLAREGADATAETAAPAPPTDGDSSVVHASTGAQRRRLVALRADGTIGDAAFQRLEEELDWTELGWAQVLPPADRPEQA